MIVGNIENGLERGFVKHCLNQVLIIDPKTCAFIVVVVVVGLSRGKFPDEKT